MPRMKGESQRQYMDRLRAVRGLPPMETDPGKLREQLFAEVRAAKALLSAGHHDQPGSELLAFMHIFHPDHPTTGSEALRRTALEMNREARN